MLHRVFFFEKFGTHFISGVACGGTLYYYFAVSKQANLSSNQISASASAEYQGLNSSGQAQANAYWSQCALNWSSFRKSYAVTVPATTGVIDWVNPPVNSFDQNQQFADWKTAVTNNPSHANFSGRLSSTEVARHILIEVRSSPREKSTEFWHAKKNQS